MQIQYGYGDNDWRDLLTSYNGVNITYDILDVATPKFLPVDDVPKYIRDIKGEAVEAGIKGTKNLNKYLNVKQVHTITTNTFYNDIASRFGSRIFR